MAEPEDHGLISGLKDLKKQPNKLKGLVCWVAFIAIMLFLIIMTSIYTRPKGYHASTQVTYLVGEDQVLFRGLGPVFMVPTTRKMNALAHFQLGLNLLHVFWYDQAIVQFREARKLDPRLAMAYWGEAMCYKQTLWQSEDVASAQAILALLDSSNMASFVTDRERQYITAAKMLFYGNNSLQQRETDYTAVMVALAQQYQDDPDACALAGLSMLGQLFSVGGYLDADGADQMRYQAEEQLGDCLHFFPDHVGSLHYYVYLFDVNDLSVAEKGKSPALRLGKDAPASNLAQHMRSHIFLRFGNWSAVVDANTAALAASDGYCKATMSGAACDADNRYHALEWQLFGQVQQCGFAKAKLSYYRMQTVAASMNYTGSNYAQWLYRMYSHMQLQSMGFLGAVPLKSGTDNATTMVPPPLYNIGDNSSIANSADIEDHFWPPHAEAHALLARVQALMWNKTAAQLAAPGVMDTVTASMTRMAAIVAGVQAAGSGATDEMANLLLSVQMQARALMAAAQCAGGGNATFCAMWPPVMDQALDLHNSYFQSTTLPTLKIAPTPEWYGNLLLMTGQDNAKAAAMFDLCLAQMPGRMQCVYGRGRAARALGDADGASTYFNMLWKQCQLGDAKFAPLMEARAYIARPPPKKAGRMMLAEE